MPTGGAAIASEVGLVGTLLAVLRQYRAPPAPADGARRLPKYPGAHACCFVCAERYDDEPQPPTAALRKQLYIHCCRALALLAQHAVGQAAFEKELAETAAAANDSSSEKIDTLLDALSAGGEAVQEWLCMLIADVAASSEKVELATSTTLLQHTVQHGATRAS